MRITIGQKTGSSFSDPLGLLGDCHRRIEHFLNLLTLVTNQAQGQELNQEQKEALASCLRYFREAAPKHKEDEEKSLFPRMRNRKGLGIETVMATLDTLEADHQKVDQDHLLIDQLYSKWLAGGKLSKFEIDQVTAILTDLQGIYQRHIAVEDTNVFPLARKVLEPSELASVGQEMMSRRGIKPDKLNTPN
jgi:hemerythrin-like domain-containing protein